LNIHRYLNKKQDSSSLAIFRLGFGFLMLYSIIRIWSKGWIESLYLLPSFHFSYLGFEWVKPVDNYTYLIFLVCAISSFFVAIGYKYRFSVILLFLSFTYVELMDKTTYLNHYYLVSLISFLMIFLPANASYSLDSIIRNKSFKLIPKWNIDTLKLMICIVYFYAGIAKINSDWLLEAQPLKIWLTSKYDLPILGNTIFQMDWIHVFFSWSGMFYDLLIAFILLNKKTRPFGFIASCLISCYDCYFISIYWYVSLYNDYMFNNFFRTRNSQEDFREIFLSYKKSFEQSKEY